VIEDVVSDEVHLKIELDGKAEPLIIGLPFSLIGEAKLVTNIDGFRDDLSGSKPTH
jgi:hypothetical protein